MSICLRKEVNGTLDETITKLTKALSAKGFGILTRIDFHQKMKEKLGRDVAPTVILGACNPNLAFEAYMRDPEVTAVVPCNAVVRELRPGRMVVELARPTELMKLLDSTELVQLAKQADGSLSEALEQL